MLAALLFSLGATVWLASVSLNFSSLSSSVSLFVSLSSSLSSGDLVSLSMVTVFGTSFSWFEFSESLLISALALSVLLSSVFDSLNAFSVNGYSHESDPRSDV